MQTEISFNTTREEARLILAIADRCPVGMNLHKDKMGLVMDLTAVHCNGNPMDLERLLGADDFNFAHDVVGIQKHLNRETGELENFFSPRFSRRESPSARALRRLKEGEAA